MCGRYALTTTPEVLAALLHLQHLRFEFAPRYNIAPTQKVPVARTDDDGSRELVPMRWGLIPSWAKDSAIGNRMINARSESAAEKPAFRAAMKKRRCLVPVSGFYEWQKRGTRKQPFYIHRADGDPMALAGLWENWTDPAGGGDVLSFTILTTSASEQIKHLHDRMPVVIEPEDFDRWLDLRQQDASKIVPLLRPAAEGVLAMHPVSSRVNTPKNDDPSLVEEEKGVRGEG